MNSSTIILVGPSQRRYAHTQVDAAPDGYSVVVKETKRTEIQNRKLWPMLSDVSRQVEWYGRKLSSEDWKNIFTASLKKQDTVPGIDGGVVILGQSTSNMSKRMFADLISLIYAFGDERGVIWSGPQP